MYSTVSDKYLLYKYVVISKAQNTIFKYTGINGRIRTSMRGYL